MSETYVWFHAVGPQRKNVRLHEEEIKRWVSAQRFSLGPVRLEYSRNHGCVRIQAISSSLPHAQRAMSLVAQAADGKFNVSIGAKHICDRTQERSAITERVTKEPETIEERLQKYLALQEVPVSVPQIAGSLRVAENYIYALARKLVARGAVKIVRVPGSANNHYVATHEGITKTREGDFAKPVQSSKLILECLGKERDKALSRTELALNLSLPYKTVDEALQRLIEAGLVGKNGNRYNGRRGRPTMHFRITHAGLNALRVAKTSEQEAS